MAQEKALQIDSRAPYLLEDSFLEPTEGSHQGWGLWVNEPGKKSRASWEGWPETGLCTERTKAEWAPVHSQVAQSGLGGLEGVVKPGHRCQKVLVLRLLAG